MATNNIATEPDNVTQLKGTAANPARDPKVTAKAGNKGSIGDVAFKDALIIVILAWVILLMLVFSLRHHSI